MGSITSSIRVNGAARVCNGAGRQGGARKYEHSETWEWDSGEKAVLPFVSVHKVVGDKITLWKDYWDMAGLTAHAPSTWLEDLASADTSWVFDATGLI